VGRAFAPNTARYTVCQYCGPSVIWNRGGAEARGPQEAVVRGMRLRTFSYMDAEGTGLELVRLGGDRQDMTTDQ
jgi:hypothetical protein